MKRASLEKYSLSILIVTGLLAAATAITGQHANEAQASRPGQAVAQVELDEPTSIGVDDVPDNLGTTGTFSTATGPFPGTPLPNTDATPSNSGPVGSSNLEMGGAANPAAPNRMDGGQVPFNTTPFNLDDGTSSGMTAPPGQPQDLFDQSPADGALSDGTDDSDFYQPAPGSFGEASGLGEGAGIGSGDSFSDSPSSDQGTSSGTTTTEP